MKIAVVTGAGHGIGKAIAFRLMQENCHTILLDNNVEYLQQFESEYKDYRSFFTICKCNVANYSEVKVAVEDIKKNYTQVDYLVNNAGISKFTPLSELSIEEWNRIIAVNLNSAFYLTKFLLPVFADPSSIVNIASTRAFMSEPDGEAYAASKGGIVAITHALANSLGPKTRVNCISPGWIEINDYGKLTQEDHTQHPAGKVGIPQDIAEATYFLLSEKAKFITGQNLIVDGGMTKKMIYV